VYLVAFAHNLRHMHHLRTLVLGLAGDVSYFPTKIGQNIISRNIKKVSNHPFSGAKNICESPIKYYLWTKGWSGARAQVFGG
jgi:hypothetical protein